MRTGVVSMVVSMVVSGRRILSQMAMLTLALLALAMGSVPSMAQSWPSKTVKFILPLGPGSGADIGARLFADHLSRRWGKPVVVENRPGADGVLAINAVLAAKDDHTLCGDRLRPLSVIPTPWPRFPMTCVICSR